MGQNQGNSLSRRQLLQGGALLAAGSMAGVPRVFGKPSTGIPPHLKDYRQLYAAHPRLAARTWFSEARFGLFMHFGLYSQLADGEWVMYRRPVPYDKYSKLFDSFDPKNFDADFITDLALDAGMRYVNMTSKHHDGFCLFDTKQTDYNSVKACGRDLCAELAQACQRKGLGCFFYYSLAADWHHPYFLSRELGGYMARPDYKTPPAAYKLQKLADFDRYIRYAQAQVRELLDQYGPLAGVWFDPYMGYFGQPAAFRMEETYRIVRHQSPSTLISFKQGATGTEDFAAPEREGHSLAKTVRKRFNSEVAQIADQAWKDNAHKHNEICDTLQPQVWGYRKDVKHKGPDEVMKMLEAAEQQQANLLLNTGPLPDGSIHPEDVKTLRTVGKRLRRESS
jgi:alpha-L-fucosidase